MPIEFKIFEFGPTPRHLLKHERRIRKDTWLALADHWFREFRPKHFTHRGASEYGYTPRSGEGASGKAFVRSYTGKKLKRFGHTYPLVWSGTSMRRAQMGRITGTSKYARVSMNVPAFNFRPKFSSINMRAEMETISRGEAIELTALAERTVQKEIERLQDKTTSTAR